MVIAIEPLPDDLHADAVWSNVDELQAAIARLVELVTAEYLDRRALREAVGLAEWRAQSVAALLDAETVATVEADRARHAAN